VSTCVHEVKWRANTHLWVVNRGIELLAKSPDPMARKAASRMSEAACNTEWQAGLWDADDGSLSETGGARGSHFYNAAGRDFEGNPTKTVTYLIAGVEQTGHGNARTNAKSHLDKIGNLTTMDQCHELGLALHYLTDMTQPMHASSFSAADIPINLHPVFEDYIGNVQARFPTSSMTWDKRFQDQTADNVLDAVSKISNSLAPGLHTVLKYNGTICTMTSEPGVTYTGYCFIQVPDVDAKIGEILTNAYQSAASYIYAALKGS
jgi:phospholipase C